MLKVTEGEKKYQAELLPAEVPAAPLALVEDGTQIEVLTEQELLAVRQMADSMNRVKLSLDALAVVAKALLESDYDLDDPNDYKSFVGTFGNRSPFRSSINEMDNERKKLKKYVVEKLIDGKVGGYISATKALLCDGVSIRRAHDEKVAAIESDKRAKESARVERINAETERMAARTDALVRLPVTMIGKESVAIKAAIAEASIDFQFQEEKFFDEFIDAALLKQASLLKEQEACLKSLQTLLASAESDEKAKVERAKAEQAEEERKKKAELEAEAERNRQQQELEEANKITEILMSSVRLANCPPADIRAGIEKISALTGEQKLLDAVSVAVSALQDALVAAEKKEADEKEKAEAAEAARLKAAEEEWVKREEAAAAEKAAKEEAAKKAAAEAEEKRKAKEAEAKREAEEREDADLEKTINALRDFTLDRGTAEKLLTAVLSGEIPHLSWSNKC